MPSVSSDRTIYTLFCFFTAPVYGDEQTQVDDYYGGEFYIYSVSAAYKPTPLYLKVRKRVCLSWRMTENGVGWLGIVSGTHGFCYQGLS